MMQDSWRELDFIQFGICSAEEIRKQSVCEVNHLKLTGPHSVYDERMGTLDSSKLCKTCNKNDQTCVGHFGHMELSVYMMHPLFHKLIMCMLKCVCYKCKRILMSEEQLDLNGILRFQSKTRFHKILEKMDRIDFCSHCQSFQPKFVFSSQDRSISMIFKMDGEMNRITMDENEIFQIFDNMSTNDVRVLGFNPDHFHPRNLIIRVLPVLPPAARPFIIAENVMCDDDLTLQYLEIAKANHHLRDVNLSETRRQKYLHALKFRIKSLFDNSGDRQRVNNGRPLKGIKKRLTGKEGLIRNNLMGKRVDKSARTVIGPDPTLAVDEIAIPRHIANVLTYPVRVNQYNRHEIQNMIDAHEAVFLLRNDGEIRINLKYATSHHRFRLQYGDVIFRKSSTGELEVIHHDHQIFSLKPGDVVYRDGKRIQNIPSVEKKKIAVCDGDIIERKLRDGDILLLNRQPTLHKGSMIAQKVRIREGKAIRLNLAITSSFNADFDGDEMNLHCPANPETEAELRILSSLQNNLVSPQSSKANIVIVQDSLLAAYKMTKKDQPFLSRERFMQIVCAVGCEQFISRLPSRMKRYHDRFGVVYNGRLLFSLLLPDRFHYRSKNDGDPDEPEFIIEDSLVVRGAVRKVNLGSSHSSLITVLFHEYGEDVCVQFINNVQFLAREYLLWCGFTVGIRDCVVTRNEDIQNAISRSFIKARSIEEHTTDEHIREVYISYALGNARDTGLLIAKNALPKDNAFLQTVMSGAKGDYFNIAQITGILGQQNLNGKRVEPVLSNNSRTLPHYPIRPEDYTDEEVYESRGFIRSCFLRGLSPRDFYFHAMTGREGITDTAMKSVTGDTMIFVCDEDFCCYQISIGQFIDSLFPSSRVRGNTDVLDIRHHKFSIPSVNQTGHISWLPITHVTRHDPTDVLYEITTYSGRSVTVTAAKSLIVYDNERLVEKHMDHVHEGDLLPVSYNINMRWSEYMTLHRFNTSIVHIREDCIAVKCDCLEELHEYILFCSFYCIFGHIRSLEYLVYEPYATKLYNLLFPTYSTLSFSRTSKQLPLLKKQDVVLDPIIQIRPITGASHHSVYDLTVPYTFNFALANGLQVRDTATSGYIQRRMIKIAEDIKVAYDGTVRNANQNIIQFAYGENFMNPVHTQFDHENNPLPIKPSRIIDSLNRQFQ